MPGRTALGYVRSGSALMGKTGECGFCSDRMTRMDPRASRTAFADIAMDPLAGEADRSGTGTALARTSTSTLLSLASRSLPLTAKWSRHGPVMLGSEALPFRDLLGPPCCKAWVETERLSDCFGSKVYGEYGEVEGRVRVRVPGLFRLAFPKRCQRTSTSSFRCTTVHDGEGTHGWPPSEFPFRSLKPPSPPSSRAH